MDWRPLTSSSLRGHQGRPVLITRADGKGYYGIIRHADRDYIVLENGSTIQRIICDRSAWHYCFVELPRRPAPKMGHPRLLLENYDG